MSSAAARTAPYLALHTSVSAARARLAGRVRETPCERSPSLEALAGAGTEVFVKLENLQHTGSFKARGALNRLLSLTGEERTRGVVAASSGNHGAAVAWGAASLGVRAIVYVPEDASPAKVANIQRHGAEVRHFGTDGLDTELEARDVAHRERMTYVSPYNDLEVVAGQGTIGAELAEQAGRLDAVYVAVGGGGMIGGIAAWLAQAMPAARVIGALPAASPVMERSVRAGAIVAMESQPTLSDGTAGGIEPGAITFPVCRDLVQEWVLVDEAAIAAAMRHFMDAHHQMIEGAAGVALAAYAQRAAHHAGERVGIVICGANIALTRLRDIL